MTAAPIWLAVAIIACFALAAWMVIWSRADTWARPAAVALFLLSAPLIAGAMAETLGRAKPITDIAGFPVAWELDREAEYLVLSAKLVQDVGIWIYLDTGAPEPRSYRLAWSNEQAQAIQEAMDGAPQGQEGRFVMRFDPSQDTEMSFHELPQQQALPPKPEPESGVTYTQPE